MTNTFLGAAMMAAPMAWWAWLLLKAMQAKDRTMEVDLVAVVLALLCWMAGRVLAGKSMLELTFG